MLYKKYLTNKHMKILWKAWTVCDKLYDAIFVRIYQQLEKLQQKTDMAEYVARPPNIIWPKTPLQLLPPPLWPGMREGDIALMLDL